MNKVKFAQTTEFAEYVEKLEVALTEKEKECERLRKLLIQSRILHNRMRDYGISREVQIHLNRIDQVLAEKEEGHIPEGCEIVTYHPGKCLHGTLSCCVAHDVVLTRGEGHE